MGLPNIAEDAFGNFIKLLGPLLIVMLILLALKWFQSLKRKSPQITVVRPPST